MLYHAADAKDAALGIPALTAPGQVAAVTISSVDTSPAGGQLVQNSQLPMLASMTAQVRNIGKQISAIMHTKALYLCSLQMHS